MRYYKVYAQCVRKARPIKEIYEQDVYDAINDEVVADAIENNCVGNSLDEQIDVDVMTKKTEILGNIGEVNSVRKDSYGFFGADIPCVLLTDEYAEESEV